MSKATIMMVEDSKFIQDLMKNALSQNEQIEQLLVYDDAESARAALHKVNPDLILLNIVLPGMSGIEFCRALRLNPATSFIPVIFLTSSNTEKDLSDCYDAGAVDFVFKPFRGIEINARINTHLEIKRIRDVMEATNQALISANRELLSMAQTDELTKLANRRRASEVLDIELSRAMRYRVPFSIVMVDIDHFKRVNDTFGHAAGDLVLQQLGNLLQHTSRRSDVPARWGGEEFLVLLPHTNHLQAAIFADRVRNALDNTEIIYEGQEIRITLTMGIAGVFANCTATSLTELADRALYYGKEHGRNQVVDAHTLPDAPSPLLLTGAATNRDNPDNDDDGNGKA